MFKKIKDWIAKSFNSYTNLVKTKEYRKRMFINIGVFGALFIFVFTVDWTTKNSFFDFDHQGSEHQIDKGWIGIRSYAHYNTTMLSFIKANVPDALHHAMTVILALIFLMIAPHASNYIVAAGIGCIFGGIIGNGFDRMINGYVRDIIYTPWMDNGTYNIADILTIVGSGLLFIGIVYKLIKEELQKKKVNKGE